MVDEESGPSQTTMGKNENWVNDPSSKTSKKTNLNGGDLSEASARFDVNKKGHLSESERIIRKYDVNNDGEVTIRELKGIVRDLQKAKSGSKFYRKVASFVLVCFLVSFAGNFGLTWSV